jgi:hypothetical protein
MTLFLSFNIGARSLINDLKKKRRKEQKNRTERTREERRDSAINQENKTNTHCEEGNRKQKQETEAERQYLANELNSLRPALAIRLTHLIHFEVT